MPSKRNPIPSALRTQVLGEFRHMCALCGKASPQLHHIDGDKNHNIAFNLLPLCPNHHLLDVHSPTNPIPNRKLQLFRKFRDPALFLPQFQPLFERMQFLFETEDVLKNDCDLPQKATDLLDFLSHLKMGEYYAPRIAKQLAWNPPKKLEPVAGSSTTPSYVYAVLSSMQEMQALERYPGKVNAAKEEAIRLIIEALRFQNWKNIPPYAEA